MLGASIVLEAGGVTQRDHVRLTDGFRSQVPTDLHVGLGDAASIDRLEVRWPSGRVESWTDLPADQLLTVHEGAAEVEAGPLDRWPDGSRPQLTGRAAPTVEAAQLGGGRVPLAADGPAVVNFWAPWCAPCNVELPQLVTLSERYGADVHFAGVSVELEDMASVHEMIERFGIPYPQFLADDDLMERFFGTEAAALPSTFVFDNEGRLRRLFRGAVTEADLDAVLESFSDEGVAEAELSLAARFAFEASDYRTAVAHYERLARLEPDSLAQVGVAWEHRRAVDRLPARRRPAAGGRRGRRGGGSAGSAPAAGRRPHRVAAARHRRSAGRTARPCSRGAAGSGRSRTGVGDRLAQQGAGPPPTG